jgi:hypothetical protein
LLAAALVLAGCGAKKAGPNLALLDRVPVYPGAASPKTSSNAAFDGRDWTLPAHATADSVITWYEQQLGARGWKIVGKSFFTLRATRGRAAISVGVRGRTLEAIANSQGA